MPGQSPWSPRGPRPSPSPRCCGAESWDWAGCWLCVGCAGVVDGLPPSAANALEITAPPGTARVEWLKRLYDQMGSSDVLRLRARYIAGVEHVAQTFGVEDLLVWDDDAGLMGP